MISEQTVQTILEFLRSPKTEGKPTAEDKLRLVIVFFLSSPGNTLSKDDIAELEKELKAAGANTAAFDYVRRVQDVLKMTLASTQGGTSTPMAGGQQGGVLFRGFSALGNKASISFSWIS